MLHDSKRRSTHQLSQVSNAFGLREGRMFSSLKNVQFPCPVCGYGLANPAANFTICPSCGVEFGYSDAGVSHPELRAEWIESGPHWSSQVMPQPARWNAWQQLIDAGFGCDITWLRGAVLVQASTYLVAELPLNRASWPPVCGFIGEAVYQ